jgi:hypothetical protein
MAPARLESARQTLAAPARGASGGRRQHGPVIRASVSSTSAWWRTTLWTRAERPSKQDRCGGAGLRKEGAGTWQGPAGSVGRRLPPQRGRG